MKSRFLLVMFLIMVALYADEEDKWTSEVGIFCEEEHIHERQNYFLTSTPYRIASKVNPATGEYYESEMDLCVAGSEPLSIRRFYHSFAPPNPRYGDWLYNPEAIFVANFEFPKQDQFVSFGTREGCMFSLKPISSTFSFDPTHFFSLQPNGQMHPLNMKVAYERIESGKKRLFQYKGTITEGDGRKATFLSPQHYWLDRVTKIEKRRVLGLKVTKKFNYYPENWTPYQLPIVEERLPNGNLICYSYTSWKKEEKGYPIPPLLSAITAYNQDKSKVLGFIQLGYYRSRDIIAAIEIRGSDGRCATLRHDLSSDNRLAFAKCPGKPSINYDYYNEKRAIPIAHFRCIHYDDPLREPPYRDPPSESKFILIEGLQTVRRPNGSVIKTEYDDQQRVSAQYGPVGPNGKMVLLERYHYEPYMTQVTDGEGNKTDYHFDENKKLNCIATLKKDQVYRVIKLDHDPKTGNVTKKTILHENRPLQVTEYKYDKNQNPIEEKVGYGNEWRIINRSYSDDGFNLKLSEQERPEKITRYHYLPNTNLLIAELTYEKSIIRKRIFHRYDDCAICIQTIIDDGATEDPTNLVGVTYRKVTNIIPRLSLPCFGLPEIIEEKTLGEKRQELSLGKVVYSYTPFGKVQEEAHYDNQGKYRYSLFFTYDAEERLIAKQDALGGITQYNYDENHNLISVSGPRDDFYQEIQYDSAQRPIRIIDWQSEGPPLVREKKYNTLGQLIEECDPCKKSTRIEYDVLGNVTAVFYPDGGVERKEYDVLGNVITEISAAGYETHTEYNAFSQPTFVYYPDGSTEQYTYYATGMLHSHVDKNGIKTIYTYDIFDHPIKVETYSTAGKLCKSNHYKWTPFHLLSESDGEHITHYQYDFAGRKIKEENGYKQRKYGYDVLGRLLTLEGKGFTELYTYDLCDKLLCKKTYAGSTLQRQESYLYDALGFCTHTLTANGSSEALFHPDGKLLSTKDPLGYSTHYTYQYQNGFTKEILHPDGTETSIDYVSNGQESVRRKKDKMGQQIQKAESRYDHEGNLVQVEHSVFKGKIPLKTITHRWEYGPLGRLEQFIEADQKVTRYEYDDKGRLHAIIKPDGNKIIHCYDELGRLSRYSSKGIDYKYSYDAGDRLIEVLDQITDARTNRVYDSLDEIIEEKLANGFTLLHSYDEEGRRTNTTLWDGSTISYEYEGIYLKAVSRKGITYLYSGRNLEGEITQAESPIGVFHFERDGMGRLLSIVTPTFLANEYQYDAVGNLLHYDYDEKNCQYRYDALNQLIYADGTNPKEYQYDSLGNRLEGKVNDLCQITQLDDITYEYDACGNLIFDGTSRFTYDGLDRLVLIQKENTTIKYTYDPFDRRLSKEILENGRKIKKYFYIWDGEYEIGCVNESGIVIEFRVLGEGLGGSDIGAAVLIELEGKPYIPIHDQRGSLVSLIDPNNKQEVGRYRYAPFGEEEVEGLLSPWRFASKRVDDESGLVYFGRRYYSPTLGRWITPDPNGFEDGPNVYAYLHNCPLNDFDPLGLWSWQSVWDTARDFGWGACTYVYEMGQGAAYSLNKMGEWMYADFQYEYFNDASLFHAKSISATEGWRDLGSMVYHDPMGALAPGLMEAWRNPTDAAAWGKAAVDIGLAAITICKGAQMAGNVGRCNQTIAQVGRLGEGLIGIGNTRNINRATSFMGRRNGFQLEYAIYQKERNIAANIRGRPYSAHAIDRLQDRGYFPSIIDDTISHGIQSIGKQEGTLRFYNSIEQVSVIVNEKTGNVITIIPGRRQ